MVYDVIELIRTLSTEPETAPTPRRPTDPSITCPADLPLDWRIEWEQRAAIMEYDGNLPRPEAEREALIDIVDQMQRDNSR